MYFLFVGKEIINRRYKEIKKSVSSGTVDATERLGTDRNAPAIQNNYKATATINTA